MASFNRVILMGNLTRDIELKYTQTQLAVTEIGLAVNEKVKRNNEWVDETTFVDVTLWGRLAEIASEYLSKGSPILIEGRLKLDSWETDGQKRSKLRVVAEQMRMLGSRSGGGSGGSGQGGYSGAQNSAAQNAGGQNSGAASATGSGSVPAPHTSNRNTPYDSAAASHQIQEDHRNSGGTVEEDVPF